VTVKTTSTRGGTTVLEREESAVETRDQQAKVNDKKVRDSAEWISWGVTVAGGIVALINLNGF